MKKVVLLAVVLSVGGLTTLCAQTKKNEDNLKPYYVVLLKSGPHRDQDSATAVRIQKEHMENINRLAAEGKLNVAGPFLDNGDLRGIFIFDMTSEDEVKALVDNDPAVRAGRLIYDTPLDDTKGHLF